MWADALRRKYHFRHIVWNILVFLFWVGHTVNAVCESTTLEVFLRREQGRDAGHHAAFAAEADGDVLRAAVERGVGFAAQVGQRQQDCAEDVSVLEFLETAHQPPSMMCRSSWRGRRWRRACLRRLPSRPRPGCSHVADQHAFVGGANGRQHVALPLAEEVAAHQVQIGSLQSLSRVASPTGSLSFMSL